MSELQIREKLDCLPDKPGVYLLKDEKGKVLYIGKALSLRKRVRFYFSQKATPSPRINSLIYQVKDMEWMITDSEAEAFTLESNLIKHYHPYYNIQFRDDKSYPYIKLTTSELFPRLFLTRNPKEDGSLYFGPYTNVKAARKVLLLIHHLFPLRRCKGKFRFRARPCLNYHIKECSAPCVRKINERDYASLVKNASLFLQGHYENLLQQLQKEMDEASREEKFEKAARIRDRIRAIHRISQSQKMTSFPGEDRDMIGIASDEKNACIIVFLIREGKVVDRKHFLLDIRKEDHKEEIIAFFLKQYYARISFIPPEIILPDKISELTSSSSPLPHGERIKVQGKRRFLSSELRAIERWLSQKQGRKVKLEIPARGKKLKLMRLIEKNAYLILKQERRGDKEEVLDQLKEYLGLKEKPLLIEGFDVSNIRGREATGAVVVFEKGKPKKSEYRRFKIKTVGKIDDFAMLSEVIHRRYCRALKEKRALPQLILVDGGKGQVSSCIKVMRELNLSYISVIGLAKEFEEVYLPHSSLPLDVPQDSAALKLLQEIRDEAHRFAHSYHIKKRRERIKSSSLDVIPGIGEKTKRLLLTHFKSVELIKGKNPEVLQRIPGVGEKKAQKILKYLMNNE